jgi:ribosome-associated toxin RatA of RatAB toxin-antitoxin module
MAQADQEKTYDVDAGKYFRAVTDYEKYPEIVDGMKSVKVAKQSNGHIFADYELSMMSKEMKYSLDIQDNAAEGTVDWKLIKSDFFKTNNGAWKIKSAGEGKCTVHYSVEVEFNFPVPGFILKGVVKSTLPTMMNNFFERAKTL